MACFIVCAKEAHKWDCRLKYVCPACFSLTQPTLISNFVDCPDPVSFAQAEQDGADGGVMSETQKACLIYRSSQKRIAREYLIRARQELGLELERLRKLQERQ